MAGLRKHVPIDGKKTTGVTKRPNGRSYIIDNGQPVYFGTAERASATYREPQEPTDRGPASQRQ